MRFQGIIKSWNDDRGFGFIEPTQGGQEIFLHVKAFSDRSQRPVLNQTVTFEVELGQQGKKRAKNVATQRVATSHSNRTKDSPAQWGTATLFTIPAFLVIYALVSVLWKPPLVIAAVYLGISVLTFIAYGLDKAAAKRGVRRTPETTLHMLALACGWPGALLAQQYLRHKSSKAAFRSVFWCTVALNVAAFVFFASPAGRSIWAGQ